MHRGRCERVQHFDTVLQTLARLIQINVYTDTLIHLATTTDHNTRHRHCSRSRLSRSRSRYHSCSRRCPRSRRRSLIVVSS